MQTETNNSFRNQYFSALKIWGLLILSSSALLSSLTGQRYFLLLGLVGFFLFGLDAHKQGKLKQFIGRSTVYLLLIAILMYLQFKGVPWG